MTSPGRTAVSRSASCGLREGSLRADDPHLAGPGTVGEAAGDGDGVDHLHAVDEGVAARLVDLAVDEERPIVQDLDADARVLQVVGRQPAGDRLLELTDRLAFRLDVADQRQRDVARAVDLELAGQILVPEYGDPDLVAGAQRVGVDRATASEPAGGLVSGLAAELRETRVADTSGPDINIEATASFSASRLFIRCTLMWSPSYLLRCFVVFPPVVHCR